MQPGLSNSDKSSHKGDNINELRPKLSISFVWVEHFLRFGTQESKSQCFCSVFFGSVDDGGGPWVAKNCNRIWCSVLPLEQSLVFYVPCIVAQIPVGVIGVWYHMN